MDIPNFSPDKPYKFVLYAAIVVLVYSLENSFSGIDINNVRTTCAFILFYALCAWAADESYKNSLKEDVRNEQYDEDEADIEYDKRVRILNFGVILLSIITILFIFD